MPGRPELGKRPQPSPPRGGRRACPAQAGHPLPATRCRAAAHTLLKATPRPRQAVLLTRPSHHPSVLQKRNRLGKGASWTPGFRRMPTCSRGCWEGALAGPTLGWSKGGSSPIPFSARAPLPGHILSRSWKPSPRRTAGLGGPHIPFQGQRSPGGVYLGRGGRAPP